MRDAIARLMAQHHYDAVVCDFLAMAPNFAGLGQCIETDDGVTAAFWLGPLCETQARRFRRSA